MSQNPNIKAALNHFAKQQKSYEDKEPADGYSSGQKMYNHRNKINLEEISTYILLLEQENTQLRGKSAIERYKEATADSKRAGGLFSVQPLNDVMIESKITSLIARKAYRLKMLEGEEMTDYNITARERTSYELKILNEVFQEVRLMIIQYWRRGHSDMNKTVELRKKHTIEYNRLVSQYHFLQEILSHCNKSEKILMEIVTSIYEKEKPKSNDWINQIFD